MQSENRLQPYIIQSKNTKFFIITTPNDKDGREVQTAPNHGVRAQILTLVKPHTDFCFFGQVLHVTPIKGQVVPQVLIQGVHKLYVALEVSIPLHNNGGLTDTRL